MGPREEELLLVCVRAATSPEQDKPPLSSATENLNYEYLLRAARAHGVLPLLARYFGTSHRVPAPLAALERLREQFHENAKRNAFLTAELLKLLRLFESHAIVAVPFKGPTLAKAAYGNLALRQFADLDILVRAADVHRAGALLRAHGYRPSLELTDAQEIAFLRLQWERPFSHGDGAVVDLHWRLAPDWSFFSLDLDELWLRLQWVSLCGTSIRTLSPEDMLLTLCAHGGRHCWERLGWIADVAALIRTQPGMDWRRATDEAERLGGARILFLGLLLARELGGAPIPDAVVQLAKADGGAVALVAEVRGRLLREAWHATGIFEAIRFHLRTRERLAGRLLYLARRVLTPSFGDFALMPLPAPFSFLYYALRPLRLMARYLLSPLLGAARLEAFGPGFSPVRRVRKLTSGNGG